MRIPKKSENIVRGNRDTHRNGIHALADAGESRFGIGSSYNKLPMVSTSSLGDYRRHYTKETRPERGGVRLPKKNATGYPALELQKAIPIDIPRRHCCGRRTLAKSIRPD